MKTILSILIILIFFSCKKETPKRDFVVKYHAYCKSTPFKVTIVTGINEKKEYLITETFTVNENTYNKDVTFHTSPDKCWQPYIEAETMIVKSNDSISCILNLDGVDIKGYSISNNPIKKVNVTAILSK